MRIVYLICPNCGKRFYIHEEFAGHGYDWFCPFCQYMFKEGGQENPSNKPAPSPQIPASTDYTM
jgi:uncharacterized Zn finger protein (UPF0148 family)